MVIRAFDTAQSAEGRARMAETVLAQEERLLL